MTLPLVLCCAALLVSASPLIAQNLDTAPRGGVFGSGESPSRSQLDLTVSLAEALDSEAPPELRSRIPQGGPQSGGYSTVLTAFADYSRQRRRAQVAGTAFTAFRYYQTLDQVSAVSHSAALGATLNLARRTTLEVNQTGNYSPSFLYQLFPTVAPPALGEAVQPALDYRVDELKSYSYNTRMTLAAGSARGNQASISVERLKTDFQDSGSRPDLDVLQGRAKWSHGVGRTGVLSAEYEYRVGEFGYGGEAKEQRLRMGASYFPALSTSRRAAFRFNLAPSALEIPETATNAVATGTLYRLEGDLSAEYPVTLRWSVGGSYRRGVEYIAVLREPVFRDVARLEVSGLLSRRIDVSASAGYVVGASALTKVQGSQKFDTYTGTARGRYAISRSVAMYAEYLYYYYDLRGQLALAPDLPSVFEQQGVRAGVMLWARPVGR